MVQVARFSHRLAPSVAFILGMLWSSTVAAQSNAWPQDTDTRDAPRQSADGAARTVVSLRWENDVIAGTDDNYSNGTALTLARDGSGALGWLWKNVRLPGGRLVSNYEFGQLIVTPKDIRRTVPDPNDRPYAGLLYVAVSTQRVDGDRFDGVKVITGVVGPAALAESTQKAFHRMIDSPVPQGWDFQLQNEPILNVVYEHRRRYALAGSRDGW